MEDVHFVDLDETLQSTLPGLLHNIDNAREVLRLGLDHRLTDALLIEDAATVLHITRHPLLVRNQETLFLKEPFPVEEPLQW